jgi:hypothetical protein
MKSPGKIVRSANVSLVKELDGHFVIPNRQPKGLFYFFISTNLIEGGAYIEYSNPDGL